MVILEKFCKPCCFSFSTFFRSSSFDFRFLLILIALRKTDSFWYGIIINWYSLVIYSSTQHNTREHVFSRVLLRTDISDNDGEKLWLELRLTWTDEQHDLHTWYQFVSVYHPLSFSHFLYSLFLWPRSRLLLHNSSSTRPVDTGFDKIDTKSRNCSISMAIDPRKLPRSCSITRNYEKWKYEEVVWILVVLFKHS